MPNKTPVTEITAEELTDLLQLISFAINPKVLDHLKVPSYARYNIMSAVGKLTETLMQSTGMGDSELAQELASLRKATIEGKQILDSLQEATRTTKH